MKTNKKGIKKIALFCVLLLLVFVSVFAMRNADTKTTSAYVKDEYSGWDYRTTEFKITDKGPLHNEYDVFGWSVIPLPYEMLVS